MVTVNLYDALAFAPAALRETAFSCDFRPAGSSEDALVPVDDTNLVMRAVAAVRQHAGTDKGVRIELIKRIPVATGLAGGSSDAAATLAGLNQFWKLGLTREELMNLAAQLGSDVAFFLAGSAATCRGRGEIVEPLKTPTPMHFVVACPDEGLSTAAVYGNCRPAEAPRQAAEFAAALCARGAEGVATTLFNRLRPAAEQMCEGVRRIRQSFSRLDFLGHEMSGSGTSYYGLCRHARHARRLAQPLSHEGYRVFTVRSSS